MRHGHRAAGVDLLVEQRHDRPRRGQYIAEAHHAESRLAAAPLQTLQHDFGEALGRAHHIGGIDRLVGRYQNEGLDVGLMRRLGRIPGGDDIVINARDDILFDDGHMLVGGRVVHRLHAVGRENIAQAKSVVRIADETDQIDLHRMFFGQRAQLSFDVVERQFGHFEQHQPTWVQSDDLPAQLRADGAAGAGDHDHPVADAGVEQTVLRRDRVSTQQIRHIDFAQIRQIRLAGHELLDFGDGLHVHAQGLELSQNLAATAAGQ